MEVVFRNRCLEVFFLGVKVGKALVQELKVAAVVAVVAGRMNVAVLVKVESVEAFL